MKILFFYPTHLPCNQILLNDHTIFKKWLNAINLATPPTYSCLPNSKADLNKQVLNNKVLPARFSFSALISVQALKSKF